MQDAPVSKKNDGKNDLSSDKKICWARLRLRQVGKAAFARLDKLWRGGHNYNIYFQSRTPPEVFFFLSLWS